jgi:hypothetical protein
MVTVDRFCRRKEPLRYKGVERVESVKEIKSNPLIYKRVVTHFGLGRDFDPGSHHTRATVPDKDPLINHIMLL